ncbi:MULTISPECIES: helix-turn-helix domain-containing protein [Hungatella]|uniref:helix-turn-helix domain-containing protein n=1 Tax=Hungatella TaxID=1649459 RepID=UPI0018C23ADA|nr:MULTISPECIES: helix-turn-helix domain-containing protein [Hungatella]MCQ4830422.1 AraC family transcriptional regulator [Hungatella sp. SL.1.14]
MGIKHKNTRDSKWKNILKSRHFRSFFFITFLFTTIIFIIGGVVITLQNRMKLHENLEMKANYVALSVQDNLSNMKNSAVFMGNLASIERVLEAKSPTLDQLVRMTNDVTPYSTLYHYESICLFFNRSQRIFDSSGGMYDYDDFYDKELIETLENMKGEEMWLINVPYKRYYSPDPAVAVITYARRLPLYKSQGRGYVTVSYSLGRLQKAAAEAAGYTPYTATVCFQDHLLWSSSDTVMKTWDNGLTAAENEGLLLPGTTAFSSFSTIGARCSFHASKLELLTAVSATLLQWFLIYLAAAAADFAASMVYGMIMLRPVDAIMKKIGINPYTEIPGVREDEFSLISTALDNLNAQLSDIGTVMHENQQLVRERLLSGILYNYVDITSLPPEYEEHGLLFPFPYYAVILISLPSLDQMEDYTRREQLKLVIRTNTTNAFSALGTAYSLYIDNKSICIILNTGLSDTLSKELSRLCTALKKRMKQTLSVYPLFSIGICSETEPAPWQVWQLARHNFIFTAADADDFVLFSYQNEFTSSIDQDIVSHITQAIIDKNGTGLKEHTDAFRNRYLENGDEEEVKRLALITVCTIYASLLEMNGDIPDIQMNASVRKLENASTIDEINKHFCSCLFGMLDAKNKISTESYGYIQKAVQYIEQNYSQPITIPQIAGFVGVSSIYLTKLFKLSTGKTLSEYLNYHRTQKSLDLLTHTEETINWISEAVGYSDVRSYIRFFKKFYYMTPSEYRKEH